MDVFQICILFYCVSDTVQAILSEVHIYTPNMGNGILSNPKAPELSISLNQYGFNVSEKTSIYFEVKACEHAFIYLSESPVMNSTAALYEIIIGASGGTRVILRKHTHVNVGVESLGSETTQCELFLSFWISWGNSNIKIGKGLIINQDIVIDWTEPDPFNIAGVGITTGFGSSGQWILYVEATGSFCLTPGTRGTMSLLTTERVQGHECPLMCLRAQNCMGYNFNNITETCELISSRTEMTTVFEPEWIFGTKCFQQKCLACF